MNNKERNNSISVDDPKIGQISHKEGAKYRSPYSILRLKFYDSPFVREPFIQPRSISNVSPSRIVDAVK